MAREFFDLVVGHPAPPEFVPSPSMVQAGESDKQRLVRVMRFILNVRTILQATPISAPALAALACRIVSDPNPEAELPVVCGAPLGMSPRQTIAGVMGLCAMWGMPAKAVEASEEKAAELAALLATQRQQHDARGPHVS